MLTDLIAAKPEDAAAILSTQGHANVWPTLEAKGVDQIKLTSLRFIVTGLPLEDDLVIRYIRSFEDLSGQDEDGPWLFSIPGDLASALAQLPASQIRAVAQAWADTEECKADRWKAKDVEPFLGELSAFSATAVAQDQKLLLWVCL